MQGMAPGVVVAGISGYSTTQLRTADSMAHVSIHDKSRREPMMQSLDTPRGLAFDYQGDLYVADTNNHRVVMWKKSNLATKEWGFEINSMGGMYNGVVVAGDSNLLKPVSGFGFGRMDRPWAVTFDAYNVLYVADGENERVMRYIKDDAPPTGLIAGTGGPNWAHTYGIYNAETAVPSQKSSGNEVIFAQQTPLQQHK